MADLNSEGTGEARLPNFVHSEAGDTSGDFTPSIRLALVAGQFHGTLHGEQDLKGAFRVLAWRHLGHEAWLSYDPWPRART